MQDDLGHWICHATDGKTDRGRVGDLIDTVSRGDYVTRGDECAAAKKIAVADKVELAEIEVQRTGLTARIMPSVSVRWGVLTGPPQRP